MGEFSRRPETVYALIWVAVKSMCISLLSFQTFYDIWKKQFPASTIEKSHWSETWSKNRHFLSVSCFSLLCGVSWDDRVGNHLETLQNGVIHPVVRVTVVRMLVRGEDVGQDLPSSYFLLLFPFHCLKSKVKIITAEVVASNPGFSIFRGHLSMNSSFGTG